MNSRHMDTAYLKIISVSFGQLETNQAVQKREPQPKNRLYLSVCGMFIGQFLYY